MQTYRAPVDSFDFALEARVQLALHRIAVTAGMQIDAEQHLCDAECYARESGRHACREKNDTPPVMLTEAKFLLRQWDEGYDAEACGCVVWFGEWLSDMDGLNETRPSVSLTPDGFVPALEVSHQGGDCEPTNGRPRATLQEAIGAAKEMETNWHFGN